MDIDITRIYSRKEKIFACIVATIILLIFLIAVVMCAVSQIASVGAEDYDKNLICSTCGETFQTVTGYCEKCGTKHSDDDFAVLKACPKCGRKADVTDAVYCHYCGNELEPDARVRIGEIRNGFVKWCVKNRDRFS